MESALRFNQLVDVLGSLFEGMQDSRGKNKQYSLSEIGLAAFSVFFMQNASFLEWQREMTQRKGRSNVQTLFGLARIASDEQIKNVLDQHSPDALAAGYRYVVRELVALGLLKQHFDSAGRLLVALDGTQYHSSEKVNCEQCSTTLRDGETHYHHTVVLPVIVNPERRDVLSLEPEFVLCEDGAEKQGQRSAEAVPSCESAATAGRPARNAAKRWLRNKLPAYALERVVILGDDLYCRQPTCETVLATGHDFVFICKPSSHQTLYEYLDLTLTEERSLQTGQGKKQRLISYRFANELPLREGPAALQVNWCEITERDAQGRTCYHNTFA